MPVRHCLVEYLQTLRICMRFSVQRQVIATLAIRSSYRRALLALARLGLDSGAKRPPLMHL